MRLLIYLLFSFSIFKLVFREKQFKNPQKDVLHIFPLASGPSVAQQGTDLRLERHFSQSQCVGLIWTLILTN